MLSELQLHLKKKVVNEYSFLSWQTLIKWKQTDQQPDEKLVNETSLVNTTVWSLKQIVELPSFLPISIYKEYQIMRMS